LKAVVLAGGYATRLRPISYALPKLLFPVLGKPMIYWTLDLLKNTGVEEVVLGVNYFAETLQAKVGSSYNGMSLKYSLESQELGTAGPMKLASTSTDINESFVAMNGDVIAQINLRDMLEQHKQTGALVTDALHEVKSPSRFGVVQLGAREQIERFVEKPKRGEAPSRLVNAGIYIIEPEVLQLIPDNRKVSLEREVFPKLAANKKLYGFQFTGHWFDIGNLTDYRKANFALLRDSAETKGHGAGVSVADDAVVHEPIWLGENSSIGNKAHIGPNALLGANVAVGQRSRVVNSILFDRVTIGEGSEADGAILGTGVKLGDGVRIGEGCVVSPNVTILDRVRIAPGAIIHPFKEIDRNVRAAEHVM
jgi:NDP-sugar pyrophosphorylase family protein